MPGRPGPVLSGCYPETCRMRQRPGAGATIVRGARPRCAGGRSSSASADRRHAPRTQRAPPRPARRQRRSRTRRAPSPAPAPRLRAIDQPAASAATPNQRASSTLAAAAASFTDSTRASSSGRTCSLPETERSSHSLNLSSPSLGAVARPHLDASRTVACRARTRSSRTNSLHQTASGGPLNSTKRASPPYASVVSVAFDQSIVRGTRRGF